MELKGSKTEENLRIALAGESQAAVKYSFYAKKAKKDGYEQIGAIFEETATTNALMPRFGLSCFTMAMCLTLR